MAKAEVSEQAKQEKEAKRVARDVEKANLYALGKISLDEYLIRSDEEDVVKNNTGKLSGIASIRGDTGDQTVTGSSSSTTVETKFKGKAAGAKKGSKLGLKVPNVNAEVKQEKGKGKEPSELPKGVKQVCNCRIESSIQLILVFRLRLGVLVALDTSIRSSAMSLVMPHAASIVSTRGRNVCLRQTLQLLRKNVTR